MKILSQDLYKKSSHAPPATVSGTSTVSGVASTPSDRRVPLQRSGSRGSSSSLILPNTTGGDYFSPVALNERIRNYVRVSNIPQEFAERYLSEESTQQLHANHSVSFSSSPSHPSTTTIQSALRSPSFDEGEEKQGAK